MPKQSDIRRAYDNDIDRMNFLFFSVYVFCCFILLHLIDLSFSSDLHVAQVISMYQRSIEIQDKLHELKVLYKSSNSYVFSC